jgi:hypothetical protein
MRRVLLCALLLGLASPASAQKSLGSNNASLTIATGLTFQVLRPATQNYNSLTVQNNMTTTDNCWVEPTGLVTAGMTTASTVVTGNGTVTAQQASILLTPGGSFQRYYPYLPKGAITVTCTNSGDSVYVDWQ